MVSTGLCFVIEVFFTPPLVVLAVIVAPGFGSVDLMCAAFCFWCGGCFWVV